MKANQKGSGAVKLLLVLVIVGVLGLLGWYVLRPKKNTDITHSTACSATAQTKGNQALQLPADWNWYDIKDAEVKYAYPANWKAPTDQTNSGVQKYVTSFTLGSSGADTTVTLSPDCTDFQFALSDINNGKFDTSDDTTTTKAIGHSQSSYSSLSHWSSDAGNHYQLVTYNVVNVGSIKSVMVEYSLVAGSAVCPDDRLASNDQTKCITQAISDEVDRVISSLQKI